MCIIKVIDDGEFDSNLVFVDNIDKVVNVGKVVYIMGFLSLGGVYSYEDYIVVMIEFVVKCGVKEVYFYGFLDGCDMLLCSVKVLIECIEVLFVEFGCGCLVIFVGCYYVMDCDNCWNCVEFVYDVMVSGIVEYSYIDGVIVLEEVYVCDENDEFVVVIIVVLEG